MNNIVKEILEWGICIVIAVTIAIIVRYFIGTPTEVRQSSMYPTLKEGQRLILNKMPKTFKQTPKKGDIITFERPSNLTATSVTAKYDYEPNGLFEKFNYYVLEFTKESYIKRLIALPGEHVEIKDGKVYVNEQELEEEYLRDDVETYAQNEYLIDFVVPEGHVFAMGDNRTKSTDCRQFGCIPIGKIEGVVWIRIWPFDLFGEVKGEK